MHSALDCIILFSFCYNCICFVPLSSSLAYKYTSLKRPNLVVILICIPYLIYHALETNTHITQNAPLLLTRMKTK